MPLSPPTMPSETRAVAGRGGDADVGVWRRLGSGDAEDRAPEAPQTPPEDARAALPGERLPMWRPLPRHLGAADPGPRFDDPRLAGRFVWDVYGAASGTGGAVAADAGASQPASGSILAGASGLPRRPAMTRRLFVFLALLGVALPATAALLWPVAARTTSTSVADADTAAQRAFETARFDAIHSAWTTLRTTPHTRRTRTEQHDRDGLLRAYRDATTRGPKTLAQQSGGEFDYGLFTAYISEITTTPDPHDVGALALSNLSGVLRHVDAYAFTRRDTAVAGQYVQIVEASARFGAGDGRNVRRFTLLVEPESGAVVGVDVRRIDLGTWFREESRARVETQRLPDGRAVPARTDFESLVVMPFSPSQPISTTAIYTPTGG